MTTNEDAYHVSTRDFDYMGSKSITVYVAQVKFSTPAEEGWYVHSVECTHEHRDYEEGQRCQNRLLAKVERLLARDPADPFLGLSAEQVRLLRKWEMEHPVIDVKVHIPKVVVQDLDEKRLWDDDTLIGRNPFLDIDNWGRGCTVHFNEAKARAYVERVEALTRDYSGQLRRSHRIVLDKIKNQLPATTEQLNEALGLTNTEGN